MVSFPPGTEMFQFPGFALLTLCVQIKSTWFTRRSSEAIIEPSRCARNRPASRNRRLSGGFPHSDIPGSKGALASPGLIAECHVLHRLLLPRHPPNALIALDPIQKTTGPFAWRWFIRQPASLSGRKSLTRRRSLGRGGTAVASPEQPLGQTGPRVSVI